MKKLAAVAVLAMTGCAMNATLYPKGGGDIAQGSFNGMGYTMEVTLKGETYRGNVARGGSSGMALVPGQSMPIIMGGVSNQYSSVMVSAGKTIRCEFMLSGFRGGNGVCSDSTTSYDLVIH